MSTCTPIGEASLQFSNLLSRRPWAVVLLLVVVTAISMQLMRSLQFDFTPQAIYSGNDELVTFSEQFKHTFGYEDALILVLLQSTGADDVLSTQALNWQVEIARDFSAVTGVIQVDSLATLQVPRRSLLSTRLEYVVDEDPVSDQSAARARDLLQDAELLRKDLLSSDERLTAIVLFLGHDRRDLDSMKAAVNATKTRLTQRPPPAGFKTLISGLPALRVELVEGWVKDLMIQIPLAACVNMITLWLVFRRVSGSVLPILAVGLGLTWTLAAFATFGVPLNFVSNALPALLVVIGVSGSTQVVACYASEAMTTPDRRLAARNAIARMVPACTLASLTTVAGFLSLMTTRSLMLSQFGWQAAIGVALLYLGIIVTLGALFQYFEPPPPTVVDSSHPGFITRIVTFIGSAAARRPWFAVIGAVVLAALALSFASQVSVNTYAFLEILPENHPSIKTMRLVEKNLTGIMPLEVSLRAKQPGCFGDPETFHRIRDVEEFARKLPGVITVRSYVDTFHEILSHWPGRRRTDTDLQLVPLGELGRTRLERTAEFAEQYRTALHLDSLITPDQTQARIQMRLAEIGSKQALVTIEALEEKLQESFPDEGPIVARVTGEGNVNARALSVLVRDLYYSLLTASIVIFGLIAIEFRSLKIGLIAALPNLAPLTVTLGYMGLRGFDMNVTNVIVFTICLGLADDNTIYFLYRFRQELAAGATTSDAIQRAFMGTGRAIVITSGLLLTGLSVLFLSDFVPTRRFAELSIVTLLANLFGVLLLLPACLMLIKPLQQPKPSTLASPRLASNTQTGGAELSAK